MGKAQYFLVCSFWLTVSLIKLKHSQRQTNNDVALDWLNEKNSCSKQQHGYVYLLERLTSNSPFKLNKESKK